MEKLKYFKTWKCYSWQMRLSHYCEFKVEHLFPNQSFNHFSIIVWPPPCTVRSVLSWADITCFISGSVAVDWRLNVHTFSHQIFPKKWNPPPWLIILMKIIRLFSYYLLLFVTVDLVVQLDLWVGSALVSFLS